MHNFYPYLCSNSVSENVKSFQYFLNSFFECLWKKTFLVIFGISSFEWCNLWTCKVHNDWSRHFLPFSYFMFISPNLGKVSALRTLRVLRALKTVTTVPGELEDCTCSGVSKLLDPASRFKDPRWSQAGVCRPLFYFEHLQIINSIKSTTVVYVPFYTKLCNTYTRLSIYLLCACPMSILSTLCPQL